MAFYAKGKQTLYAWVCLAHYPSVSQEGIPAEIRQGPPPLSPVAFRGKEALRPERAQLHGDLQPHPPSLETTAKET